LEEITAQLPLGVVFGSVASLKVKTLYILAAPVPPEQIEDVHHMVQSKAKLIDMIYDTLESQKKAGKEPVATPFAGLCAHMWGDEVPSTTSAGSTRGLGSKFGRLKGRLLDLIAQRMVGSIDVEIKDIHLRYEDAISQEMPLRLGLKVRGIFASSEFPPSSCRATGDWKHLPDRRAKPILQIAATLQHLSAYLDQGGADRRLLLLKKGGPEIPTHSEFMEHFQHLKARAIFSARVVEQLEILYPPKSLHRKKRDEGCTFRDRFDYHRYVLLPAQHTIHLAVNSSNGGHVARGAIPAQDIDCHFGTIVVMMDTNQMQIMNKLWTDFRHYQQSARLCTTRPQKRLSECREWKGEERRRICRAWWRHAVHSISVHGLTSFLGASQFRTRDDGELMSMKAQYMDLWANRSVRAAYRDPSSAEQSSSAAADSRQIREIQVNLPVATVLDWRSLALTPGRKSVGGFSPRSPVSGGSRLSFGMKEPERHHTPRRPLSAAHEAPPAYASAGCASETSETHAASQEIDHTEHAESTSMQFRFHVECIKGYLLAASRDKWTPDRLLLDRRLLIKKRMRREPILGATVKAMTVMLVRRGRNEQRVLRWLELEIQEVDVINEKAMRGKRVGDPDVAVRDLLHIDSFKHSDRKDLCVHLAANSLVTYDESHEPGDIPLSALVYPAAGVAAHLGSWCVSETEVHDRVKYVEAQDRSLEVMIDGKQCEPAGSPALDVEASGGTLYVRSLNGGIAEGHPALRGVKVGQVVLQVNGRVGIAAMQEELKKPYFLCVKLRRDGLFRDVNFVYIRTGRISALDYTPYRERLLDLLAVGRSKSGRHTARDFFDEGLITKLMALDKELLVRIQRFLESYSRKVDAVHRGPGKMLMSTMVEGEIDGALLRQVNYYNRLNVLCKELILPPTRWQTLQSACPNIIHVRVQGKGRDVAHGHRKPAPESKVQGLMAWKLTLQVLAREDFYMGLEVDILDCFNKRPLIPITAILPGSGSVGAISSPRMSYSYGQSLQPTSESRAVLEPVCCQLASFYKFGRSGDAKHRYFRLDPMYNVLIWFKAEGDSNVAGCLPLEKVQDICIGVQTRIMKKAASRSLFDESRVFSIIAADRTLDMQAGSKAELEAWVDDLRRAYFEYFLAAVALGNDLVSTATEGTLPKSYSSKIRAYPEAWRHLSCKLKSDCRKMTTLLQHDAAVRLR